MKIRQYCLLLFLIYSYIPCLAQVDTGWVRRLGGPWNDNPTALSVDIYGNVYVTGASIGAVSAGDYVTIKYSPTGDILWIRLYNGAGNGWDAASALAVDNVGNVYVTGYSYGEGTSSDYATIKYDPKGDILWVRRYTGPANYSDEAFALAVDAFGNVYVTGGSYSGTSFYDYATAKYASKGAIIWVSRYNGPGNGNDQARALAVDGSGNVYVAGYSAQSSVYPYNYDYATIKYASNGDTLWVRRYNGPGNHDDIAGALAVDDNGNVYVTGYSAQTSVYPYNYDYATIKYASNGNTSWVRRYNGPGNFVDEAIALVVDDSGNTYVSGSSQGNGTLYDYATIKYSPTGDTLWVRRYNGPGNSNDEARDLALDGNGNIYVTGYSYDSATSFDYVTLKYAPNGDTLWVKRYNGPGNGSDEPFALEVDDSGNVYVTGRSDSDTSNFTNDDFVTIKYVQCFAKPGDVSGDGKVLLPDIITIINYLFKGQPAPNPFCRADANADGAVLLSDIIYLINFLFKSGPGPIKSRECCL